LSLTQISKNKKIFSLGIIKIIIIFFASVYLIGNFEPFFEGVDAYLYGLGAIAIVNGSFEYTNELLETSDFDRIFASGPYVKTIHDTLIPIGGFGIYPLSALSYFLGGYYGLFYLGPIITILFLITSERVTTKLFGNFAGLVTLIFLSTDRKLLTIGEALLTDTLFGLLLLLGGFFLIKFFKEKSFTSIFICSSLLTAATFFRYQGIIFFPIEILLISGYFLFQYTKNRKNVIEITNSNYLNQIFKKLSSKIKKILKITLLTLGPWSIFFIFLLSFNTYFFGEPFLNYLKEERGIETGNLISSYFIFNSERLESIQAYLAEFVPDGTYYWAGMISFGSLLLTQDLFGIISLAFLLSALIISLYFKISRTKIIIFMGFILGMLLFYSSNEITSFTSIKGRFMIPVLPFAYGILGYLMYRSWEINFSKIPFKYSKIMSKSWKGFLIIIFVLLIFNALYYSKSTYSMFVNDTFEFKNPQDIASRYPLDKEGFTEKSVIVERNTKLVRDYDAISFNPFGGYNEKTMLWSGDKPSEGPIQKMHELLDNGYELFVFKIKYQGDPSYYRYLETEKDLILKEHSETFCKLIRIENDIGEKNMPIQSDEICHTFLEN